MGYEFSNKLANERKMEKNLICSLEGLCRTFRPDTVSEHDWAEFDSNFNGEGKMD